MGDVTARGSIWCTGQGLNVREVPGSDSRMVKVKAGFLGVVVRVDRWQMVDLILGIWAR
jgi:hypothetical protein